MNGNHVVTGFAPVLVNGVPYVPESDDVAPSPEPTVCYCRRCFLHDDPAGCLIGGDAS